MKLNVGCGNDLLDDYINIDIRDLTYNIGQKCFIMADIENLPFDNGTIEEIRAIDVLEHVSYHKTKKILKHWVDLLIPNGILLIQSPCITTIFQYLTQISTFEELESIIAMLYGGQDYNENYHKTILEPKLLAKYLQESGITGEIKYKIIGQNLQMMAFK